MPGWLGAEEELGADEDEREGVFDTGVEVRSLTVAAPIEVGEEALHFGVGDGAAISAAGERGENLAGARDGIRIGRGAAGKDTATAGRIAGAGGFQRAGD